MVEESGERRATSGYQRGNRAQEALAESVRRGSLGTTRPVCAVVLLGEVVVREGESEREEQVKREGTRVCGACNWLWSLASSASALRPSQLESAGAISHGERPQSSPQAASAAIPRLLHMHIHRPAASTASTAFSPHNPVVASARCPLRHHDLQLGP